MPPDDPPTLHLTDVSDSHPVASQLVGPNLIPEVDEVLPSPTPCIVMLDAPVPLVEGAHGPEVAELQRFLHAEV